MTIFVSIHHHKYYYCHLVCTITNPAIIIAIITSIIIIFVISCHLVGKGSKRATRTQEAGFQKLRRWLLLLLCIKETWTFWSDNYIKTFLKYIWQRVSYCCWFYNRRSSRRREWKEWKGFLRTLACDVEMCWREALKSSVNQDFLENLCCLAPKILANYVFVWWLFWACLRWWQKIWWLRWWWGWQLWWLIRTFIVGTHNSGKLFPICSRHRILWSLSKLWKNNEFMIYQ